MVRRAWFNELVETLELHVFEKACAKHLEEAKEQLLKKYCHHYHYLNIFYCADKHFIRTCLFVKSHNCAEKLSMFDF